MRYRKRLFLLLAAVILAILLLKDYSGSRENIVHLKNDNNEFKRRPENSIESTILNREKEVYDHVLQSDN
ncbi:hypothetical protein GO685_03435 [Wolbachia endosymbiont of Madathamugadia hiepei]|uniref:hypothetical protein n=1 Tax=Wolbachia endosymbiont of Madathamugadia hiepei TaxID=1241303 RepID=UPI00158E9197|nr:hypothetical protein [Wolbachia endosymbiont of Madathamugadia hiepei]NUX01536.1 hypothetical protein [Wolbachia endosymbiont of Madathamugadia hiepei]